MGDIYDMAKDIIELKVAVQELQAMFQQVYNVIEYNLKQEVLEEPKEPKEPKPRK